jgi:hypothetical protein
MLVPAELARLESAELEIQRLLLAVQFQQAGSRNRFISSPASGASPTTVTAAMTLNFAAVAMVSQASGVFDVSITENWSGATTADTGTWSMTTQTGTGAATFTNGTVFGALPSTNGVVSNAAAGVTVATGGGGSVSQGSLVVQPALTGILAGEMSWRGLVHGGGGGAFARFALGNNVIFLFALNATHGWTLAAPTVSIIELT